MYNRDITFIMENKMQEEKDIQKALKILKRIQFQLQYILSDLYKCGGDTVRLESILNEENEHAR